MKDILEALQFFRSGGDWGKVKAWVLNGAPTQESGVTAGKKITAAQSKLDLALLGMGESFDAVRPLSLLLDALDEWGCDDNTDRAKQILDFQSGGYDLSEYLETQTSSEPEVRPRSEPKPAEATGLSARVKLQQNDAVWAAFYRDGKTLGEISEQFGCGVYDLSPWLTAPLVRAAMKSGAA